MKYYLCTCITVSNLYQYAVEFLKNIGFQYVNSTTTKTSTKMERQCFIIIERQPNSPSTQFFSGNSTAQTMSWWKLSLVYPFMRHRDFCSLNQKHRRRILKLAQNVTLKECISTLLFWRGVSNLLTDVVRAVMNWYEMCYPLLAFQLYMHIDSLTGHKKQFPWKS